MTRRSAVPTREPVAPKPPVKLTIEADARSGTAGPGREEPAPAEQQLRPDSVSAEFLALVPRDFAREHLILSQGRENGVERLAIAEGTDPAAVFNTGVCLGIAVEPRVFDAEAIARAIDEPVEGIATLLTDMAMEGRIAIKDWEEGFPIYILGKS